MFWRSCGLSWHRRSSAVARSRRGRVPAHGSGCLGNQRQVDTMSTTASKAAAFRALHEKPGAFIIPNPWDAGTARLLAALGFEALATTSLGLANMLGRPNAAVSRAEVIANTRTIVEATPLPVNVDLENGFAHQPEEAAEAVRLAAEAGAAGGSIEDFSGDRQNAIYDFDLSVARVKAAVAVARAQPVPFLLTAR